ncbi:MAG: GNAT family N-acetyltransferase [Elusimicrobia bacterium]|nr:GNAT family N-acetyltransferase [Elusimicrobiota bacterium]
MDLVSGTQALAPLRSGQRVLVGSGAAAPQALIEALAERAIGLSDVEVLHLMTLAKAPYAAPSFNGHVRHNALFIGANTRDAVGAGLADYTPCFLHEVPGLFRSGHIPLDVALIQVSPPRGGVCSLGVSVDVVKAAVESAAYVVAQVNENMPWTEGDSTVSVDDIDAFVAGNVPLLELPARDATAEALWIGRYVRELVEDGATIQVGIGAVPDAVLAALAGKKDLGVHSEMISDGVLDLWKAGVVTGKRKSLHPGRIVTSFCMGSRRLYETVNDNPHFLFHPSDYVNDPVVVASNQKMVSINSALLVDLTGQVAADSLGGRLYSGVGGQVDFVRGAAASRGGKSIIVLPSTAKGGTVSRIATTLSPGTGVVTTRADIDYVVTEYGIASLKAKTIRQRAVSLIQIAHPRFRAALAVEAEKAGLLDAGHILPPDGGRYPIELQTRRRIGKLDLVFRPLSPADERALKDLFYAQSEETTAFRFGTPLSRLSEAQFQELVAIDFRTSMALGAFLCEGRRRRLVGVARYHARAGEREAELSVAVRDDFQRQGVGGALVRGLAEIGVARGLESFRCEERGPGIVKLLRGSFSEVRERSAADGVGRSWVRLADRFADRT